MSEPHTDRSVKEDRDDLALYLEGEARAGERLFERYSPRLFRYLQGLTRSAETAADMGQEVVLRLLRNDRGALRRWYESPQAPFWSYLRRIAIRLWIDHCRAARCRIEVPLGDVPDLADPEAGKFPERIGHVAGFEELTAHLSRREVKILALLAQGLSGKQMAAALNCTEGNAWVLVHRLRRKLRERMDGS